MPSRKPASKGSAAANMHEPKASRPYVPGYGIPTEAEGMLPWRFVEERLAKAMNYWVCTTNQDGTPHARPVWGVWVDGALCFGGHGVRWDKNLEANPNVSVHLESGDEVVILEGAVTRISQRNDPLMKRGEEVAKKKYGMGGKDPFWALRPRRAFAWTTNAMFKDATRWHFS